MRYIKKLLSEIREIKIEEDEWAIFFDYWTGEILRCVKGDDNNVTLNFNEDEFKDHHIASIHNHPENVYSPPSDRNFGILMRDFEDYELVASGHELWILKAKGRNPIMYMMLKMSAEVFLVSCQNIVISYTQIVKRLMRFAIRCMESDCQIILMIRI